MSEGYVYVLSNPSMPGIVKIGRSKHGGRVRARALYNQATGVPTPFKMEFEMWFKDCEEAEILVHEELQTDRINDSREFFQTDEYEAIKAVISVYARGMDCIIGRMDETVDEVSIKEYAFHFNNLGYEYAFPDIALALSTLRPEVVFDQITRIDKQRNERKRKKENETT